MEYSIILCSVGLAIVLLSKFVEAIHFNPVMVSDEYLSTCTGLVAEVEPDAWVAFHINSKNGRYTAQRAAVRSVISY